MGTRGASHREGGGALRRQFFKDMNLDNNSSKKHLSIDHELIINHELWSDNFGRTHWQLPVSPPLITSRGKTMCRKDRLITLGFFNLGAVPAREEIGFLSVETKKVGMGSRGALSGLPALLAEAGLGHRHGMPTLLTGELL